MPNALITHSFRQTELTPSHAPESNHIIGGINNLIKALGEPEVFEYIIITLAMEVTERHTVSVGRMCCQWAFFCLYANRRCV